MLNLPIEVLTKIFQFIELKQLYQEICTLCKDIHQVISSDLMTRRIQSIYFLGVNQSLSKCRNVTLPFWGYATDGFCLSPLTWVDTLFMSMKQQIKLQNCQTIQAKLSKRCYEMQERMLEIRKLYKDLAKSDYIYLSEFYANLFKLTMVAFGLRNGEQKDNLTKNLKFLWDRTQLNSELVQKKFYQMNHDYLAVLKSIHIKIKRSSQTPKTIIIFNQAIPQDLYNYRIKRSNVLGASGIQDHRQSNFKFKIFDGPGPIAQIDFTDSDEVFLELNADEWQLISDIRILMQNCTKDNEDEGSIFEFVQFKGYLLDLL